MGARGEKFSQVEGGFMRRALALAARAYGSTYPNPMVGAVIVRDEKIIGEGWHKRAGEPHAEINAITAARRASQLLRGASVFVTLEPCSTFGRTPPCVGALIESGFKEVIVSATDPNPKHSGHGLDLLRRAGLRVRVGLLRDESNRLNEAFNHRIVSQRPFVLCKCAMSLDGKIATNSGESKWITSEKSRRYGMRLRLGADAIIVGVNTILRDDPALSLRPAPGLKIPAWKRLRRIILDPQGRIPLTARVLTEELSTTVVVTSQAAPAKVKALENSANVIIAPTLRSSRQINLRWLLKVLGRDEVTSVLVEGGGETHFSFLRQSLVNRIHFFYASLIITGRHAPKSVGGDHSLRGGKGLRLTQVEWHKIGPDLHCSAIVK